MCDVVDVVPRFDEFLGVILELLKDGRNRTRREVRTYCAEAKRLSPMALSDKIPCGQSRFCNRTNWACSYLRMAGLVRPGEHRGDLVITSAGADAIKLGADAITLDFVRTRPAFVAHTEEDGDASPSSSSSCSMQTEDACDPVEKIQGAVNELESAFQDELMNMVRELDPLPFERLVLKLLKEMGYGDFKTTPLAGDEGVDGFVYEDRFKFYSIYTQAKNWDCNQTVGRPELQKFLGALAGQGATRGIYITTARFSKEAREFVEKHLQAQIRLVDGGQLIKLMIEYGLGAVAENTYVTHRLSREFFEDLKDDALWG